MARNNNLSKEMDKIQERIDGFGENVRLIESNFLELELEQIDNKELKELGSKISSEGSTILLGLNDIIYGNDFSNFDYTLTYYSENIAPSHYYCNQDTDIFRLSSKIKKDMNLSIALVSAIEYFKTNPNVEQGIYSGASKELVNFIGGMKTFSQFAYGAYGTFESNEDNILEGDLFKELKVLYENNNLEGFLLTPLLKIDYNLTKRIIGELDNFHYDIPLTVAAFFKLNRCLNSSDAINSPILFKTAEFKDDKIIVNAKAINAFRSNVVSIIDLINEMNTVVGLINRTYSDKSLHMEDEKAVDVIGESLIKRFASVLGKDMKEDIMEMKVRDIFEILKSLTEFIANIMREFKK